MRKKLGTFVTGTALAATFVFLTCTLLVLVSPVEFMTIGVLILAPITAGVITLSFATEDQVLSVKYKIFAPWGGIIIWSAIALVYEYETLICVLLIAPLYAVLSSIGGLFAGWVRTNFCNRTFNGTSACVVLLPYLVLPIEGNIGTQTRYVQTSSSISIHAPKESVWQGIIEVPNITEDELIWTFSHQIGIPKPVSACVSAIEVGGVREIVWRRGLRFFETITNVEHYERLQYEVSVDPDAEPIKALDTHVVLGDRYFDVTHGSYSLDQNDSTTTLTLMSQYRLSTKINFYAEFWANIVFDDFHRSVLTVIKKRVEAGASKSCTH